MSDDFPEADELELTYREIHKILSPIVNCLHAGDEAIHLSMLVGHVHDAFENLAKISDATLGPAIVWRQSRPDQGWPLVTACIDLDEAQYFYGPKLMDHIFVDWYRDDNALHRAALAYRREAGWDFTPGESGVWLLRLAPMASSGGESGEVVVEGRLVGFVIMYDRNEDGNYRSVAHIWTAEGWRRRGIATDLLRSAKALFGPDEFEGPYTDAGRGLIDSLAR